MMRLLWMNSEGHPCLTKDLAQPPGPYAILSHTWGTDEEEVTFSDINEFQNGHDKVGFAKILFCAERAKKDGLQYFWIDTCCIRKSNSTELNEAINSMFKWYKCAAKCYVYLSDVSTVDPTQHSAIQVWQDSFIRSRHHTRAWTLQEILAPRVVEFFSKEGDLLGDKHDLEDLLHQCTRIPISALRGVSLHTFSIDERFRWAEGRNASKTEDKTYCLLGIFGVFMPLIYGEGDQARTRLKAELWKESSPRPWSHTYWKVPRTPNPLFTGRQDNLDTLKSEIQGHLANENKQEQCCIVISGIGGQGKSELCLQLAHSLRSKFWAVLWIDVSSVTLAEKSFQEISIMLNLNATNMEQTRTAIANLSQPWLLILDNADQPDTDYSPYIPSSTQGVVILTSRNEDCQLYSTTTPLSLRGLSLVAARDLVFRVARVPENQQAVAEAAAVRIAELLHGHPLAIVQAGAYVSRGHCSLDQFPLVYETHRRRLLQYRPSQACSRYGDVYATFEAAVDALKQSTQQVSKDALELLSLLAMCGSNQLPLALFASTWIGAQNAGKDDDPFQKQLTSQHVACLPSFLEIRASTYDSFRLMEAAQLLRSFAIVMGSTDNILDVSLHPLVHAWARDRQELEEQHQSWLSMACCLAFAIRCTGWGSRLHRQLVDHVDRLFDWDAAIMFGDSPNHVVIDAIATCAKLWSMRQCLNELLVLTSKVLSWLGSPVDQFDNDLKDIYILRAWALNCHSPVEAIHLLHEILEANDQRSPGPQPPFLEAFTCLALIYSYSGQGTEGLELMESVIRAAEHVLPSSDLSLLNAKQDLAEIYCRCRRFEECSSLSETILLDGEKVFEVDDRLKLRCQELAAYSYDYLGQFDNALKIRESIAKTREMSLDVEENEIVHSQQELALSYIGVQRFEDAIPLLYQTSRRILQMPKISCGYRLENLRYLANAYLGVGRMGDGVDLLKDILRQCDQYFFKLGRRRLTLQYSVAFTFADLGRPHDTISILEPVMQVEKSTRQPNDQDLLASQRLLSSAFYATGQVQRAIRLLEAVPGIEKRPLQLDEPVLIRAVCDLADYYGRSGSPEKAVAILKHVVDADQSLDENEPSRLASQHNLGFYLTSCRRYREALAVLAPVVRIGKQSTSGNVESRLKSEETFAICLWFDGQRQEAYDMMMSVYKDRRQICKPEDANLRCTEEWLQDWALDLEVTESSEGPSPLHSTEKEDDLPKLEINP